MILYIVQALTAFYILVKGVKQYRKLQKIYQKLKATSLTNVSEIVEVLKSKKPFQKAYFVIKGIAKAHSKSNQNNILSLVQLKDLRDQPVVLNQLQKVGWTKIIQKSYYSQPRNLKNVHFYLKDLANDKLIQIANCQKSNISGALTQVYTDKIIYPVSKNKIINFLKEAVNITASMFPFNLFANKIKYGQQIKYFGIMEGQFLLAIGQVFKNKQGDILMQQPYFLTKQKSFIQKKLKTRMNYLYWIILLIGIIKLYLLYKIAKKCFTLYFKKKKAQFDNQQQQKRSQNEGDFANCIICYTNIRSIVLKPCKHYGFCNECYQSFKEKGCPLCKTQISGIVKIIKKK